MRIDQVKKLLLGGLLIFTFCSVLQAQKMTSYAVIGGFAGGFNLDENDLPALTYGAQVRHLENKWIYSVEFVKHVAAAFRNYRADESRKDRFWNLNLLLGRSFDFGQKRLFKLMVSSGLSLQLSRQEEFVLTSPVNADLQSNTDFAVGLPVVVDFIWSQQPLGGGFYFYLNLNGAAMHYGAGMTYPIFRR